MSLIFVAKIEYQDQLKRIPATEVKEEYNRLVVFNGEKKVGEFRKDHVEHWALEENNPTNPF
jgi:hypothetical protein